MSVTRGSPYALCLAEYRYTTPPPTQASENICPQAPRKPRKRQVLAPDMARHIPALRFTALEHLRITPPPTGTDLICPPAPRKKIRNERFATVLQGYESPVTSLKTTSYYWLRSRNVPNSRTPPSPLPVQRSTKRERMHMETIRSDKSRHARRATKPIMMAI